MFSEGKKDQHNHLARNIKLKFEIQLKILAYKTQNCLNYTESIKKVILWLNFPINGNWPEAKQNTTQWKPLKY